MQHHPVVRHRDLDAARAGRQVLESAEELLGLAGEIAAHLDERDDLPSVRDARIEAGERVGDATPFLDWRGARVAAVDEVPDERPEDAPYASPGTPPAARSR